MSDKWIRPDEAIFVYGVCRRTLERAIKRESVRVWRANRRCIYLWKPDLEKLYNPPSVPLS